MLARLDLGAHKGQSPHVLKPSSHSLDQATHLVRPRGRSSLVAARAPSEEEADRRALEAERLAEMLRVGRVACVTHMTHVTNMAHRAHVTHVTDVTGVVCHLLEVAPVRVAKQRRVVTEDRDRRRAHRHLRAVADGAVASVRVYVTCM